MCSPCPFNTLGYVAGLSHIGQPERNRAGTFHILRRLIPNSPLFDGMGPWPYLWIEDAATLAALRDDFRHFVSITVVAQPGFVPAVPFGEATLLKQHFVYDPRLPRPALSARARSRLRRAERVSDFRIVTDAGRQARMMTMYEGVKARRGLAGGYFDFAAQHFDSIHRLEAAVFFEVGNTAGIGAMACGVRFQDMVQILHIASSEAGLSWDASYRLMSGLQDYADDRRLRLFTGGMPETGSSGLLTFKTRWSNSFEPVYLVRITNDRARYAALCNERAGDTDYFPRYRATA